MAVPPLNPRVNYVGPNNYTNAQRDAEDVTYIVVHSTWGPSLASALSHFARPGGEESYHYVIERDGSIHLLVHPGDIAHHAGNWPVNKESIGIALIGNNYPTVPTRPQARTLEHALARLGQLYSVPMQRATDPGVRRLYRSGVLGHIEVPHSSKTDPGRDFPLSDHLINARFLQRRYGA